ncbi:MATE family efflux transporter [Clostridium sp. AL.422]|uniref:MATE family efflux transporter n=1 Tax=Clostridium TaxID=1485 RepID=UPI00293DF1EE|nr:MULTISPECIES: MATE family efflux transporter [unclassified Clostridium]MDV4150994.1 MATE family efflux transporter [Clostridium sp. AL.422]
MNITYVKSIFEDKKFMKKTIAISIPIAMQLLLNTVLNLVDTMMIGSLGQGTIAAVGLANKVFFVFTLLLFGIVSGSSILTAQYWGKRDIKNIRKVLGVSLIIGLAGSIVFMLAGIFIPNNVMRIFTPSEGTISIGAAYLSIVAFSYPLTAITNCYISLLRSTNKVKAPVFISVISILVNVVLNYTLIYGKFGAPRLGVEGAAIATVIARLVECLCILSVVYISKGPAAAKLKELIDFNKEFIKKYFVTVSPVIANEFIWGLGVTMYSLVYGRMGDEAVASITITQNVEQICIVLFQGLSSATAVILGNELGANKLKEAEKHAKSFFVIQLMLTVVMGIVCILIRRPLINLFSVDNNVASDITKCLTVFICYLPFRMFNFVNIVGVLRSGGDTKASLLLDMTGVWCVGIPFAFLGGIVLGLPIYYVYAMISIEEVYKFILGYKRYKQKKWLRNIVGV